MGSYKRLIFLVFGVCHTSSFAQRCQTPDEIEATCADLYQCESMLNLFKTVKRSQFKAVSIRLQAYKCPGVNRVCCPKEQIVLDPTTLYHNREVPPDVTGHRNYHLLPQRCGLLDTTQRATGGENARLDEFPWMAVLQYRTPSGLQFRCGGTIINYNYILTAAHCLGSKESELVSVRVGEYSINNKTDCEVQDVIKNITKCNPPVQDLKVEEIIPHPQYAKRGNNLLNDIALLRVSRISEAENVHPVCLPVGKIKDSRTLDGIVTGWGITDPRKKETADILQRVNLEIKDWANCAATFSEQSITLTKTQICAGGAKGKGSCSGDSGGPLHVVDYMEGNFIYVQHGIVSVGPEYCGNELPSIFTMVRFYTDWILDNMKP